jgi:hypothetical protein
MEAYYIPSISDLHIGYECEVYGQNTTKLIKNIAWYPVLVKINAEIGSAVGFNQLPNLLKKGYIRTLFLTKEQIEAEGWTSVTKDGFVKGEYRLMYGTIIAEDRHIRVMNITRDKDVIYFGSWKSINEFRKIVNMLEI